MIRGMTTFVRYTAGAVAILLTAAGCGVACPLGVEPGLAVEVFDAVTNAPLAGEAVGLVYVSDKKVDTLETFEPIATARVLVSRGTGAGRYTVRITRTGYAPWEQRDVVVRRAGGDCGGVRTADLQAALQPLP